MAWFYPYALTGFNPVVIGDVMYVVGRGSSLIALNATTGKEIWIHENLPGIEPRGINYWESPDHKDRRLIFSINSYLQEIDERFGDKLRVQVPLFETDIYGLDRLRRVGRGLYGE